MKQGSNFWGLVRRCVGPVLFAVVLSMGLGYLFGVTAGTVVRSTVILRLSIEEAREMVSQRLDGLHDWRVLEVSEDATALIVVAADPEVMDQVLGNLGISGNSDLIITAPVSEQQEAIRPIGAAAAGAIIAIFASVYLIGAAHIVPLLWRRR